LRAILFCPPPSPVEATFLKVKGEEQEDTGTVVEAEGGGGENSSGKNRNTQESNIRGGA